MEIPKLQIGNLIAEIPIVQGGMGVRVSLSSLAAAVANEGGIGTISAVMLGDINIHRNDYERISREALAAEIRKAKNLTSGLLAINVMGALSNVYDLIKTAIQEGIKILFFGAGLPTKLPSVVEDPTVNLVPIISSARAGSLILRHWDERYGRTADGLVLEGPLAGGHLGFTEEQLNHIDDYSLERLLPEVLESIKFFEDKYGKKIPVVVGGGIYDGKDIAKMLALGASGIQMGTRFVCTEECDVSPEFKQAYIDCKEEDIIIVKSPVGLPGRAIKNKFLEDVENNGNGKIKCHYKCLSICKIEKSKYCIAKALINSFSGDVDHGLIFCGKNAYRVNKILSVKELINELVQELKQHLSPN